MKYQNIKTGLTFESECDVKGPDLRVIDSGHITNMATEETEKTEKKDTVIKRRTKK